MPVSVIPFRMPEPVELPAYFVDDVRRRPAAEAIARGMELLLEFDVAETLVCEWVDDAGRLTLGGVVSRDPARALELRGLLEREAYYGQPLTEAPYSLAGQAYAQASTLLLMGQVGAGEAGPVPAALVQFLLEGKPAGGVGFLYVLGLTGHDGRPLGALSLLRPAAAGPLNHEQPRIAEAFRRLLSSVLER